MRRRIITGALHNFLGTFTSRYSDCDGYWMFGMLVGEISELQIDLLGRNIDSTASAPMAAVIQLATQKFREQIEKAGVGILNVREARLCITRLPDARLGTVNGRARTGHDLRFLARVVSDLGKTYESKIFIFVAPHDPGVELRSARGT